MSGKINSIRIVFSLAKLDGFGRKKLTRVLFFMTIFSVLIFLLVNSLISSLIISMEDIIHKPYGRMVNIIAGADSYNETMEYCKEIFSEEAGIGEVFWHIFEIDVEWENSDILGIQSQMMKVTTKIQAMDRYLVDGTEELGEGEIWIPKYLYGLGNYNDYTYADGAELLGKEIILTVKNNYVEENKEYVFRVTGVYDNVKASTENSLFCLCERDALDIYEFKTCYQNETYIREILKEAGLDESWEGYQMNYESLRQPHYIGFYIKEKYSVSDISAKIEEATGESCFPFYERDETLIQYYQFIIDLSNIIVFILGVTTVIVLVVFVIRDLRTRYNQIAIRYAYGYSISLQVIAFIVEKIQVLAKAATTAIVITIVMIAAGNYIIQNIMPFYRRGIVLHLDWKAVEVVLTGILAGVLICVGCCINGIRKLNIVETLKREER